MKIPVYVVSAFFLNLIPLLLLITTTACGRQESPLTGSSSEKSAGQVIVGEINWKDIEDAAVSASVKGLAKGVAYLDLPALGSRCTGFMISNDLLMTNQHCIPAASYSRGVKAYFKYKKSVAIGDRTSYDCSEFVANDEALDFAILKCKNSPGSREGKVELSDQTLALEQSVFVIHQNCDYYLDSDCDWTQKYSPGKVTDLADEIGHDADTLGGSSGSPLFAQSTLKVVGLHHVGIGNNGLGRGRENFAVPMSDILEKLETDLPQVYAQLGLGTQAPVPTPTPTTPTPVPSDSDVGNSSDTAQPLVFKSSVLSKLDFSGDQDFFSFTAGSNRIVRVYLEFSHSKGDLDFDLVNAQGKVVARRISGTDNEYLYMRLTGGKYFIRVYGFKNATNTYKLTAEQI
jgi:V8-like Glu-specific endopeptidase